MKKSDYNKPNMLVVEIQQRQLLADSDPQQGGQDVHEFRGDSDEESSSSGGSIWDEEW